MIFSIIQFLFAAASILALFATILLSPVGVILLFLAQSKEKEEKKIKIKQSLKFIFGGPLALFLFAILYALLTLIATFLGFNI